MDLITAQFFKCDTDYDTVFCDVAEGCKTNNVIASWEFFVVVVDLLRCHLCMCINQF